MKLAGEYVFQAPVEVVFRSLMDPEVLAAVLPGCDALKRVDGRYEGEINLKIGPVQGKFAGKVDLADVVEPKSYTLLVDGRGAPGFIQAKARVELEAEGEGTRLRYDADAQVGGKIATIGQRLVDTSAKAIIKQALEGLNANVLARAAAAAEAAEEEEEEKEGEAEAPAAEKAAADGGEAKAEEAKAEEAKAEGVKAEEAAKEEAPAEEAAKEEAKEEEDGAEEKPSAPKPAPARRKAARKPPVIKTDQAAFAASVAKEVTKSLVPPPVLYALAIGMIILVLWLALRS
jgi:carbon monoxide dehydrogenase subunit G